MTVIVERRPMGASHPLHAMFLAGAPSLFLGALLSDIAYARTYEIQWNNFASWLVAGGLVVASVALVCAVAGVLNPRARTGAAVAYPLLLAVAWLVQLFNALMHARDAWAGMPGGLVLSAIGTVLAVAAAWLGFHVARQGART